MRARRKAVLASVCLIVTWAGCSVSTEPGVRVDVVVEAPAAPPLVEGARLFDNDLGYRVSLDAAWLSTTSLEIFRCSDASAWWLPFVERSARAHVVGSPTLLGVPVVESLLAAGATRVTMGTLRPPADRYCRARQTVRAADADAPGLPRGTAMVGKSLLASGTYSRSGRPSSPFSFATTAAFEVDVSFPEVALSDERTHAVVLVKTGEHWFDGIDFESAPADASARRLLDNVRASSGARVE